MYGIEVPLVDFFPCPGWPVVYLTRSGKVQIGNNGFPINFRHVVQKLLRSHQIPEKWRPNRGSKNYNRVFFVVLCKLFYNKYNIQFEFFKVLYRSSLKISALPIPNRSNSDLSDTSGSVFPQLCTSFFISR